jgi:hypothetical protein
MSTADDILVALHKIYGQVHGLVDTLPYEPRAIHATPILYTLLDSMTRDVGQATMNGRFVVYNWRFMSRLVLQWQDTETAEQDLRVYADTIANLLENLDNRRLNGTVPQGEAFVEEIRTGYALIDGTEYRIADIYTIVSDKIIRP